MLEAASCLFGEHGYAGPTIAAVAEAAGVSPETIYSRSTANAVFSKA